MDVYFETEAQDRLKRIENGEDINNTESKFWVDLYDSYTQKSIQMLGGNLLLIEAIVVQKPKRTFNRN